MTLFSKSKKAAKFVFVSMPLSMLGVNQIKMGNHLIGNLWTSLKNPTCPVCDGGVMLPHENDDETQITRSKTRIAWNCNHCQWGFLEENNLTKVNHACARARSELAKIKLSELQDVERNSIAKSHRNYSRLFFVMSFFIACGFIYFIASGAKLMIALNWLAFSISFFIFGLKRSYRCWQITNNVLFEKGSFLRWFKYSKWIV